MIRRLNIAILIYIIALLLIFLFKPALMFDTNGDLKHFNYDDNDTQGSLLSIEIILVILALMSYLIVIALEMMFY